MSLTQTLQNISVAVKTLVTAKDKSELLESLVSAREEALALQEENGKLTERIRELEERIKLYDGFDKEVEDYERVEVNEHIVYRHKDDGFYACPHCIIENRKIFPLQRGSANSYSCPSCKYPYRLIPIPPVGVRANR